MVKLYKKNQFGVKKKLLFLQCNDTGSVQWSNIVLEDAVTFRNKAWSIKYTYIAHGHPNHQANFAVIMKGKNP